jgi:hypothetical protein
MFKPNALAAAVAVASATLSLPMTASAGTITPGEFEDTISVGETVSVDKTITRSNDPGTKTDVFFLGDNTGSMGGTINTAQDRVDDILNASEFDDNDIGFGVGSYNGDPNAEGLTPDEAYSVNQTVTTDTTAASAGIDEWEAGGGGDAPEANLFALQQAATGGADSESGVGTGEATGWRSGAQRVIAWFGDEPGHQDTVTLPESIEALEDSGVNVLGFNNQSSGDGIDDVADSSVDSRNQASAITNATNGELVNNFDSLTGDQVVDTLVDNIEGTSTSLDLVFETAGLDPFVDVSFDCTDSRGCTDVAPGESRDFRVDITGINPGTADFTVSARGVDAVETDKITVTGSSSVPGPAGVFLLGAGLFGLGVTRRVQGRRG